MSMKMHLNKFLPDDLIEEILSWVKGRSLVRFRCVCKSWNSLIFNHAFCKLHLQRSRSKDTPILFTVGDLLKSCSLQCCTIGSDKLAEVVGGEVHRVEMTRRPRLSSKPKTNLLTIIDCREKKRNNVSFQRFQHDPPSSSCRNSMVVGVCNGLVCLYENNDERNYAWIQFWNPTTALRSNKLSCMFTDFKRFKFSLGFGYDDSSNTYMVVAAAAKFHSRELDLRVHCLGDHGWRKIARWTDFPSILIGEGQFLKGTLNWVALATNPNYYSIFSYDLSNEACRFFSLPSQVRIHERQILIGVLEGCLCLFHDHEGSYFVVWQLEEFGDETSWSPVIAVSYWHLRIDPFPISSMFATSDLLLLNFGNTVVLFNLRDKKVEHIRLASNSLNLVSNDFVESLVLPVSENQMESIGLIQT